MTFESWVALVLALLALGMSPGPGWAAVVTTALSRGPGAALAMSVGIAVGDLVFVLLAFYGLAAAAQWLGGFFFAVKLAGALYLIYLGVTLWRKAPELVQATGQSSVSLSGAFLGGFALTLGNPKVIAFYLGFLPAFVDLTQYNSHDLIVVLVTVFVVITAVLTLHAAVAARGRGLLKRRHARVLLGRVIGSVMIITGITVLVRQ